MLKKKGRDLAVPVVEEDTSGILKVIVKICFRVRKDQARSLLRRAVGVFGSLPIISCEGEHPGQRHTATPKHPPLCARGLTCLRLFVKHERQSWQDKDRKTVSTLPGVATRRELEGDLAGGHLTNRDAPRGV